MGVVAAHHLLQEKEADDHGDKTAQSQPPVKRENQHQYSDRHYDSARQVEQLVCQEVLRKTGIVVNHLAQTSAGVLAEIAKRQPDDMVHSRFSHIGRRAERR